MIYIYHIWLISVKWNRLLACHVYQENVMFIQGPWGLSHVSGSMTRWMLPRQETNTSLGFRYSICGCTAPMWNDVDASLFLYIYQKGYVSLSVRGVLHPLYIILYMIYVYIHFPGK